MKHMMAIAMLLGVGVHPVFADEPSAEPTKLTDGDLDQVVAGDPLIFVNVAAPVNIHLDPITVKVDVPVNVAALVQANVLGNATFGTASVGTQNVFHGVPFTGGGG